MYGVVSFQATLLPMVSVCSATSISNKLCSIKRDYAITHLGRPHTHVRTSELTPNCIGQLPYINRSRVLAIGVTYGGSIHRSSKGKLTSEVKF